MCKSTWLPVFENMSKGWLISTKIEERFQKRQRKEREKKNHGAKKESEENNLFNLFQKYIYKCNTYAFVYLSSCYPKFYIFSLKIQAVDFYYVSSPLLPNKMLKLAFSNKLEPHTNTERHRGPHTGVRFRGNILLVLASFFGSP